MRIILRCNVSQWLLACQQSCIAESNRRWPPSYLDRAWYETFLCRSEVEAHQITRYIPGG